MESCLLEDLDFDVWNLWLLDSFSWNLESCCWIKIEDFRWTIRRGELVQMEVRLRVMQAADGSYLSLHWQKVYHWLISSGQVEDIE